MNAVKNGVEPKKSKTATITIPKPDIQTITVPIRGVSPYMQARFSAKTMQAMKAKMEAGSTARSKRTKEARNFEQDFREAMHISTYGWHGIPAAAFRNACIDVCRMVGFKMTHAKMSIFVNAHGFDKIDGTPLVRLIADEPEMTEMAVRNATGVVDIRVRPMWREWAAEVPLSFDRGQFTDEDVINLLARAGLQVGIGEGRPYSKGSNGLGYGLFEIKTV